MGLKRLLFVLTALVVLMGNDGWADDQIYMQARVFYDSPDRLTELYKMHLDIMYVERQFVEIVTDPGELSQLREGGYRVDIIHDDLVSFYRSRFPDKDRSGYLTLDQINSELNFIHIIYPELTTERASIGLTIEGRPIYAIKISDNPDIDEDEPEVLYTAAIHAREVITPLILIEFMYYILENYGIDPRITSIIDERELWFITCLNPDGYQYNVDDVWPGGMWRKNRRDNGDGTWGVDLNRNFGYMWGYDNDGSSPNGGDQTYRGAGPFSEPETAVLRNFCEAHEFVINLNYHSSSNLYLWAYSYNNSLTPDHDIFDGLADSANSFNGYDFGIGAIGYPVNGGANDWMYGEQTTKDKILSYTVEVGSSYLDGFWPENYRIDELINENIEPSIFFAEAAGNPGAVIRPQMPEFTGSSSADIDTPFDMTWTHDDANNPATSFELVEVADYQVITDSMNTSDNWFLLKFANENGYMRSALNNATTQYMVSAMPYTVQPGDSIKLKARYNLAEGLNYSYVGVVDSTGFFTPLEGNETTDYNPYGLNYGNGITGISAGYYTGQFVDAYFDLSDYVNQEIRFLIFHSHFDLAWSDDGVQIDDFYPTPAFTSRNVLSPDITDYYYTVSGKPEGAYFYILRAKDAQDQRSFFTDYYTVLVGNPDICIDPDGDEFGSPGYPGTTCPTDNCIWDYNPDQNDYDNDGVGDVCDDCTDFDDDGFGDPGFAANICAEDNCPDLFNPDQIDPDEDSVGTVCDNCPDTYNPGQADTDEDGLGDACDFLCGDPDGSWAINILDITFLISYLYMDGPDPVSLEHADVNSDDAVNLMDIVYLISYKYKGGPDPACSI